MPLPLTDANGPLSGRTFTVWKGGLMLWLTAVTASRRAAQRRRRCGPAGTTCARLRTPCCCHHYRPIAPPGDDKHLLHLQQMFVIARVTAAILSELRTFGNASSGTESTRSTRFGRVGLSPVIPRAGQRPLPIGRLPRLGTTTDLGTAPGILPVQTAKAGTPRRPPRPGQRGNP